MSVRRGDAVHRVLRRAEPLSQQLFDSQSAGRRARRPHVAVRRCDEGDQSPNRKRHESRASSRSRLLARCSLITCVCVCEKCRQIFRNKQKIPSKPSTSGEVGVTEAAAEDQEGVTTEVFHPQTVGDSSSLIFTPLGNRRLKVSEGCLANGSICQGRGVKK